ncbi:hypothetical protein [Endozoicomonas sp. YOMI1]|uniref:hypothetical protein n=1 Tax=Endozoicomonas sp. YOMI1 TaxID=2828739 RepID=UPI002148931C|nr:hypothetical protein [Endozoicomonas sp. YOMI1]
MTIKITIEEEAKCLADLKNEQKAVIKEIKKLKQQKNEAEKEVNKTKNDIDKINQERLQAKQALIDHNRVNKEALAIHNRIKKLYEEERQIQKELEQLKNEHFKLNYGYNKMEEWAKQNNITLDDLRLSSLIIEHNNFFAEEEGIFRR